MLPTFPFGPNVFLGSVSGYIAHMLAKELLDLLVCPKCKGDLKYLQAPHVLDCPRCLLRYRIEDDIPVMLIDEAEALKSTEA
jgi:uncharacterized protein YbaR (Trm112 family)